ncbi:phosphotransferase family protein [Nocardioides immobilis]|uniref:Phosphotransferase family protein n=1 Tax=Nocardioides immobilis TaxID=2049295 RepID=A0A417Y6K9_9ACTN|nr:phosphotransferase family protein [Nocardioides immobilis]RHW28352.1 phosphotransferase family protein [Nocardioides immobilis]
MKALQTTPFIRVTMNTISASSLPGAALETRQMSTLLARRILARMVADADRLPNLQSEAMDEYARWLADAAPFLRATGDADLVTELERHLEARDYAGTEVAVQEVCARLAVQSTRRDGKDLAGELLRQAAAVQQCVDTKFMSANEDLLGIKDNVDVTDEVLDSEKIDRLTSWLRTQFPSSPNLTISNVRAIPGGFSKQTLFLSIEGAEGVPEMLVVRMDWPEGPVDTTVVDEFDIVKTLLDAGVAVPFLHALETTGAVLGSPFLLLDRVEGAHIGDFLDVSGGGTDVALDLAREMAALHAVPDSEFGDRVTGAHESVRDRLLREINECERDWRALDSPSITLEIAFAWLKDNIELADGPRALVHSDLGCHNMLVANDRVAAIIDWESARIGTPAQDLGYVYPAVTQICDWSDFMAAYLEAGGRALTKAQIDYYTLWGFVWPLVNVCKARLGFETVYPDDIRMAYADAYLSIRFQSRLAGQLQSLL